MSNDRDVWAQHRIYSYCVICLNRSSQSDGENDGVEHQINYSRKRLISPSLSNARYDWVQYHIYYIRRRLNSWGLSNDRDVGFQRKIYSNSLRCLNSWGLSNDGDIRVQHQIYFYCMRCLNLSGLSNARYVRAQHRINNTQRRLNSWGQLLVQLWETINFWEVPIVSKMRCLHKIIYGQ